MVFSCSEVFRASYLGLLCFLSFIEEELDVFSTVVLCLEVNCLGLQLLINNWGKKSRVCELQKIKDSRIKDSLEMITMTSDI